MHRHRANEVQQKQNLQLRFEELADAIDKTRLKNYRKALVADQEKLTSERKIFVEEQVRHELAKKALATDQITIKSEIENALKVQHKVRQIDKKLLKLTNKIEKKKIKLEEITKTTLEVQQAALRLEKELIQQKKQIKLNQAALFLREKEIELKEVECKKMFEKNEHSQVHNTVEAHAYQNQIPNGLQFTKPATCQNNKNNIFKCNVINCGQTFSNIYAFKRHKDMHDSLKYPCRHCSSTFTRFDCRQRHLKSVHKFDYV